jgi:hypothetical protein
MDKTRNQHMPRARQEELLVHELTDEVLVYDLRRHKAHSLNKTAALVWQRCDGESGVTDIAQLLEETLGTSVEENVVRLALQQLERASLLEDSASQAVGPVSVSRRQLMRRMGIAAAVSLPVVVSILAPTSSQAASCLVGGAPCTLDPQCCSGNCLGNHTCHA